MNSGPKTEGFAEVLALMGRHRNYVSLTGTAELAAWIGVIVFAILIWNVPRQKIGIEQAGDGKPDPVSS